MTQKRLGKVRFSFVLSLFINKYNVLNFDVIRVTVPLYNITFWNCSKSSCCYIHVAVTCEKQMTSLVNYEIGFINDPHFQMFWNWLPEKI